jgi:hypothetical protein
MKSVIFDEEFADRFDAVMRDQPVWPEVDEDTQPMPVQEPRTVEFRAVKPPRWSRRWWRENLTWRRQVAGGMSGLVLLASLLGWWNQ